MNSAISNPPTAFTVSQLTALLKGTVEESFHDVWVSGEVTGVTHHRSGHIYFTLKDDMSKIRGVVWRTTAQRLKFQVKDGLEVLCRGGIEVYPPRGDYSLVCRQMEPRGLGALQLAFKQLQEKLAAAGLFDAARKRPLPRFPRRIAFVTSPTGAAIHDFLQVCNRRFRGTHILVIPARVQGEGSAAEIVRGIQMANRLAEPPDILVVGRGGGSLEDLWSFNEEIVVRAIYASKIPVVSAVGHEVDVTLADLVADVRALTPSEAAELAVPSAQELLAQIAILQRQLTTSLRTRVSSARMHVQRLSTRPVLSKPISRLRLLSRRLDDLDESATRSLRRRQSRLRERLASLSARLETLSPLATLTRGYSVTSREDGSIVRDVQDVAANDILMTQVARGKITCRVVSTESSEK
ncbi:MAG: exodeoxyribonuclease VII large subunit [Pirellulaceae bacterium]|nr:exodeoxyribonuclease VII large subunit [Pirellulaceae bacterium]